MTGKKKENPPVHLLRKGKVDKWNDWVKRHAKIQIEGEDFSNLNLRGAVFLNGLVKNCTFERANLTGASFSGAELDEIDFFGADISEADLSGSLISRCNFEGITGYRSKWNGAELKDEITLSGILENGDFSNAKMYRLIADEADLSGTRWDQTECEDTSFNESLWTEANAYQCKFSRCFFKMADFRMFTIRKCTLFECNLNDIWVYDWRPEELTIIRPTLTRAVLSGAPDVNPQTYKPIPQSFESPEAFYTAVSEQIRARTPDVDSSRLFDLGEPKAVCFTHETGRKPKILMTEDDVDEMITRDKEFEHFVVSYKGYSWVSKKEKKKQLPNRLTSAELEVLLTYLRLFVKRESRIMPSKLNNLHHTTTPDAKRKHFLNMRNKLDRAIKKGKTSSYRLFKGETEYAGSSTNTEYIFAPDSDASYCFIFEAEYFLDD